MTLGSQKGEKMSEKKLKFSKGSKIQNLQELVDALQVGLWIYWKNRPKHPTVLWNMKLNTLRDACTQGLLYVAVPEELP